jgi:putative FmdB family regulatory protein
VKDGKAIFERRWYNRYMAKVSTDKPIACAYGPPAWRYRCQKCGHKFEMAAPKGPSEERKRACPKCQSKDIKRLDTVIKSEACPPGG